jgi:anti-sigma B factor antagonist
VTRERLGAGHSLVVVHARNDGVDVLSLIGELDLVSAPRFVRQAAEALREGAKRLLVELDGVSFVDSAGLAALLNVLRRATASGAPLVLVGARPPVRNILAQTRLDREFTFADTIDAASQDGDRDLAP